MGPWGPACQGLEALSAASLCSKSPVCSRIRCVSEKTTENACLFSLSPSPPPPFIPSVSISVSASFFPFHFGSRGSACIFHNLALTLAVSALALKII